MKDFLKGKKLWMGIVIILMFLVGSIIVLFAGQKGEAPIAGTDSKDSEKAVGSQDVSASGAYTFVIYEGKSSGTEVFLACGTGGRLDRITEDQKAETLSLPTEQDLTAMLVVDGLILVAGKSGTLLYSSDGKTFSSAEVDTDADILALASFQDVYYASTSNGRILSSQDGYSWENRTKLTESAILSLEANTECIMAVTAETDIFSTKDGDQWESQNFNEVYDGYYEKYVFTKMKNLGSAFFVLGHSVEDPGYPLIMYTESAGEVWSFKSLMEIDNKPPEEAFPMSIYDIGVFAGQLITACDSGRVLVVTDCPTCNAVKNAVGADLYSLAFGDEMVAVVGGNFSFEVFRSEDLRQDNIRPEQALSDFQNGAQIIDVRTEEEYLKGHIKGCLHIPVDEIGDRLLSEVPDLQTELIFYCEKGTRSQAALEEAQQLGYRNVYNLGGYSDWPYETE